jgi:hypothetical protein
MTAEELRSSAVSGTPLSRGTRAGGARALFVGPAGGCWQLCGARMLRVRASH